MAEIGETVQFNEEELTQFVPAEQSQVGDFVQFNETDLNDFTPVQQPAETNTYFREQTGKVISGELGLKGKELEFLDDTQNNDRKGGDYLGFVDTVKKDVFAFGRGAEATVAALPQVAAGLKLEFGETFKQELEKDVGFFDVAKAFLPGIKGIAQRQKFLNAIGIGDKKEGLAKSERMIKASKDLIASNRKYLADNNLVRPEGAEGVFFDIGSVGTTIFASIGMSMLTRSPAPAAALFGTLQKTDSYIEAREKGFSVDAAANVSDVLGIGEAALESIGVNIFLKAFKNSKPVNRILFRTLEEAAQEGSQQTFEEIVAQTTGLREVDITGGIGRVAYSMALGSLGGASVASVVEAGTAIAKEEKVSPETVNTMAEKIVENSAAIEKEVTDMVSDQASPIKSDPKTEAETAKIIKDFQEGREIDVTVVPPTAAGRPDEDRIEERKAEEKAVKGRVKELDKQITNIDKAIDSDEALLAERKEAGKTTKAIEARIEKKLATRETLDEERANILLAEKPLDIKKVKADVAEKEISIKGEELIKLGIKVAEEGIRKFQKGFRQGQRLAKTDTKQAQETIIKTIDESGLTANDKAKFIRSIKNIQTAEQALKKLPLINSRISALLEKQQRRKITSNIRKLLKKTKPKTVSGRKKGKFDAEIQAQLTSLKDAFDLRLEGGKIVSKERAREILSEQKREELANPSSTDTLAATILSMKLDPDAVSTERAQELLLEIRSIVEEGKIRGKMREFKRLKRSAENREIARNILELTPKEVKGVRKKIQDVLKSARGTLSALQNDWNGTIDIVTGFGSKEDAEIFKARLDVFSAEKAEREGLHARGENILEMTTAAFSNPNTKKKIFGRTTGLTEDAESQALRTLTRDTDPNNVFEIGQDQNGKIVELNRAQMRYSWLMLQREASRKSMLHKNGNAWTEEMERNLNALLNKSDVEFLKQTREFLDDYYTLNAAAYEKKTGVPLAKDPHYFPIRREVERNVEFDDFINEVNYVDSLKASAFKDLAKVIKPIRLENDIDVLQTHIMEMEHFRAWSDKIQDIKDIFGDGGIRKGIRERYGDTMIDNIDFLIDRFITGGVVRARSYERWIDQLRKNFTVAVLGPRLSLAIKQQASVPAYASSIPAKDFVVGMLDFFANPKAALKILNETAFFKGRGNAINRDIKDAISSKEFSLFRTKPTMANFWMLTTRVGDKAAIAYGGWSVYRYHRKVLGKSHEASLEEFERASLTAQQASDLSKLSVVQQGNSFSKLFTMFTNSPLQYSRIISGASRNWARGRISTKDLAKQLLIFQFILPMLWQFIGDLGRWDTEKQMRAAIIGPWNSVLVMGQLIEVGVKSIFGERVFKDNTNLTEFAFKLGRAMGEIDFEDILYEDVLDALVLATEGAGLAAGVPVAPIYQIGDGVNTILTEGEIEEGIYKMLGFPDSSIELLEE